MELLSRLRSAVRKLTFLLNLKKYLSLQSTWRVTSFIRRRAPATITGRRRWGRRAMSFNDRPGLRAYRDLGSPDQDYILYDNDNDEDDQDLDQNGQWGSSSRSSPYQLRRTTSYPLEEDVDKKAEMFINNFYDQLLYEKQISLELRYQRDTSFTSSGDSIISPLSSGGSQLVSPT